MTNFADLAAQVAKQFRRDEARKQKIIARSPHLSYALDAEEYARMSSRELAARELKELGINVGEDDDPEKMLDMHHAGRAFVRDQRIPGNELAGGNKVAIPGNKLVGNDPGTQEARDAHEGSFVDRYLGGDT